MAENELIEVQGRRLGRNPSRHKLSAILAKDFIKYLNVPPQYDFWEGRAGIPNKSYGNNQHGCCTIAKQAVAATRMERIEQRRYVEISTEEVLRVYYNMTTRLYGGGDTGAYEDDALSNWRNPDLTFRDTRGRPLTIDAFVKINPFDHDEVRAALALSGARGIAVCFNLPKAWMTATVWDAPPPGTPMIGDWRPGSWGGHSMWLPSRYSREGTYPDQTWDMDPLLCTWAGMAAYMDEAHLVIDSINSWRRAQADATDRIASINMMDIRDAVNAISSIRIA